MLRIIAFQVEHAHVATGEREQIYANLGRIKRIVGQMPVEYVSVIDRMVEQVVKMLLYCQQNDYAALENLMDVETGAFLRLFGVCWVEGLWHLTAFLQNA